MIISTNNYDLLQPMYPLLIQQFVDDYNLKEGIALDIGVGPGWLGLELSKITDMEIVFFDISQKALDQSKENFKKANVDNRASFIRGDVHSMSFTDDSFDFIMSRGSIWFWAFPEKALREVYRVLKPGGVAIVGGGLGRYLPSSMHKRLSQALKQGMENRGESRPSMLSFTSMVEASGIPDYRIMTDGASGSGRWIEIHKQN